MPDELETPITMGTIKKWFVIGSVAVGMLSTTFSYFNSVRGAIDAKLESNKEATAVVAHALELAQTTNAHTNELLQKDIADRRTMMDARYQQYDTRLATADANIRSLTLHQTETDKTIVAMNGKLDWLITATQKLVDEKSK